MPVVLSDLGSRFTLHSAVWESLYSSLKISFCGIQISAGFDAAKASASKNKMLLLINFQMSCFLETGKVAKNICMKIEHADWSMNLLMPLGQTGCGSGRPGLVVGDPARNRGVETSWSLSFLTETILWFFKNQVWAALRLQVRFQAVWFPTTLRCNTSLVWKAWQSDCFPACDPKGQRVLLCQGSSKTVPAWVRRQPLYCFSWRK